MDTIIIFSGRPTKVVDKVNAWLRAKHGQVTSLTTVVGWFGIVYVTIRFVQFEDHRKAAFPNS